MLDNEIYLVNQDKYIKTPEKVENFMKEIESVCRKYGFSMVDDNSNFLIVPFSENCMDWFYNADIDFPIDSEECMQWLREEEKRVEQMLPPEYCYTADDKKECEYYHFWNTCRGTRFICNKFSKDLKPQIRPLQWGEINEIEITENIPKCEECIKWEQEKKKNNG